ncbi:MAG: WD40 repeat domain-containing protein [Bacteroidota bacterium]
MKTIKVEKLATLTGHRDSIYTIERAHLPHLLFSASGDGMVVRWDLHSPDQGELLVRIPASVYAIRYFQEENQLWIGQNFEGIHVIDLESLKETKSIKITSAAIFDIQFWQNHALIGTGDGTIIVMDVNHFSVKKHIKASEQSVRCIAINPQTQEFAVGYSDNYIRVFGLEDFQIKYAFEAHTNSVFTLAYSTDYQYLLSGSRDAHLKIWKVAEQYSLHQSIVAHTYAINHLSFSPDGKYFATGSMDKSVKVWDATSFRLLKVIDRARHAGHGTSVNKLFWAAGEYSLVACSDDRTLSVWNLAMQ